MFYCQVSGAALQITIMGIAKDAKDIVGFPEYMATNLEKVSWG
jgi:hypothetical protein